VYHWEGRAQSGFALSQIPKSDGTRAREATGGRTAPAQPQARVASASTSLSEASDDELLQGIARSSEAHFTALYDRYFPRIYHYVKRRLRGNGDAEEIVQEVFVSVFNSLEGYRGESSLVAWIYGIAKNTLNASWRKAALQRTRIEAADPVRLQPNPCMTDCTPEERMIMQQYIHRMREEVGNLSAWQAEVFAMRHLENLSIGEISHRTKRTSESVRSSLYRVKKLFYETAEVQRRRPNAKARAATPELSKTGSPGDRSIPS
jgi:RNA polymerase sigma-70 factor (ECF subfamily)